MRTALALLGACIMILGSALAGFTNSLAQEAPSTTARKSRLTRDESEAQADHRRLSLFAGEDKVVDLDFGIEGGANAITTGNPAIVLAQVVRRDDQARQLVFKPLKVGDTTVTVRAADGAIRVIFEVAVVADRSLARIANELRELFRDVEGVDVRIIGQKLAVEGELLVPNDYARVALVTQDSSYASLVLNLTSLSPLAMQVLAKRIQEDVNTFAPNVRTRVVNGVIFLEGTVDNPDQANRAKRVALLYLPEIRPAPPIAGAKVETERLPGPRSLIQSFIVINPAPAKKQEKLVRVVLHYVELSKDYNKFFGFKWEPGFTSNPQIAVGTTSTGGIGTGGSGASFSATISSLFPKLQTAQQAGYARILKTGSVVVRSGQPAKLIEQTQFPFFQPGSAAGQVVAGSSPVGLELAVTPRILGSSEDIEMDLDTDQITLVARQPSGQPITANHKVQTKIYVKSGESAAVASISSTDVGTDFNKDDPNAGTFAPGTDPLFTLKRSKNFRKKKSQFVIFVTPQIVENASDGTEDLRRNFRVKVK